MSQFIDPKIEEILQQAIFPDLKKGRKDFDLPHTKAVVHWMKELLKKIDNKELNPKVLITAAYAHDWGYIGLFDGVDSNDPQEIAKRKPLHMERGAELITDLISEKLSHAFTKQEVQQVAHLVAVHDKVEQLQTEPEKLLFEADTLGMLDVDRVKPTFSKADNERFIENEIKNRRLPAFKHPVATQWANQLVTKRQHFFD